MSKILFIDIETENHKYFGALSSPRHTDNYVVAVGQAIDETPYSGTVTGVYFDSKEASNSSEWLRIPDDVIMLVAHNAAFEMDWFLTKQRQEIMKFLKRGGRVFCTAYAEYLLSNQQDTYPSLNETAPKYGGTPKVDGIKLLWEQGKLTSQIDKDLLFDQYLIGEGGDVDNTRKTFYGQSAALQQRGMWDMALVRMEGLLYNCFSMDAGLHIDREEAAYRMGEQEKRLGELLEKFKEFRGGIPEYVGFKDSSAYHMSAWLYGGPVKYRIRDTWLEDDGVTPKYENVDCYRFGTKDIPVAEIDADPELLISEYSAAHGEAQRYKSGKNKGQLKVFKVKSDTPKMKWYERSLILKGVVPLNKLPQEVLKEFKAEFSGKRVLADGSPVYSTGADAIGILSKRPELPENVRGLMEALLSFAKIDKDLGTYYLREQCDAEGNVVKQSGMLQYVTEHDVVYHLLNCTSTVTTRLSSNRPNMQNIPRGDTSDVKRMFSSRFNNNKWLDHAVRTGLITEEVHQECRDANASGNPQGVIVEADYSALEVVTLAAFSKDENLLKALLNNVDMHCMRLSQQLKETYEDVLTKCKDGGHPEHAKYKNMRTNVKPKAFAYQYGATAMGIAFNTGCTVEEAQAFIDAEKALFPGVEKFYEDVVFKEVERTATTHREQTETGLRPYKRGTWTSPAGTTFEFRTYPKARWFDGQKIEMMEFKPTQMRNYPIQGESGFFVQGVAGQVARWLISKNFFGGRCFVINQVHDALYLDCTQGVMHEVCAAVKYIMESLPEFMKTLGYNLGVPFPVEVEAGLNMYLKSKVNL